MILKKCSILFIILMATFAYAKSETKIIPGHGPLATVEDLRAYKKMLWANHSI
jgi:hypothetical protein